MPRKHQIGRCRLQPWRGVYIAQVIKHYAKRRVVASSIALFRGAELCGAALDTCTHRQVRCRVERTQGGGWINTAYIERLNATFRARLHGLVRCGRGLARHVRTLEHGMYLIGAVYNFCTFHRSLRIGRLGRPDRANHRWHEHAPAMAAGLTDHRWSVHALLTFQVPPPRWLLPKRRSRQSKATAALVARWCT